MARAPIIPVTDHAILRYLERVHGQDVGDIRSHIGRIGAMAVAHGAPSIIADNVRFLIRNDKVITILDRDMSVGTVESYLGRPFGRDGQT